MESPRKLVEYIHALLIGGRYVHYMFFDVLIGRRSSIGREMSHLLPSKVIWHRPDLQTNFKEVTLEVFVKRW